MFFHLFFLIYLVLGPLLPSALGREIGPLLLTADAGKCPQHVPAALGEERLLATSQGLLLSELVFGPASIWPARFAAGAPSDVLDPWGRLPIYVKYL